MEVDVDVFFFHVGKEREGEEKWPGKMRSLRDQPLANGMGAHLLNVA